MTRSDTRGRYYTSVLLIPLRLAGACTLLVLSAILALALKAGIFGVPAVLILMTWFFKYSFEFLDGVVAGHTEAPVLSLETITGSVGEFRSLLPLILVIAAFFATGAARYFAGIALAAMMAACLLVCLPAVLAVQGWTGRLSYSLNPRTCLTMALSLGPDYLWALGCIFAVMIVCSVLPWLIPLPSMLRIALLLYTWLALMAAVGAALRAHLADIGTRIPLVIPQAQSVSAAELEAARQRWTDTIYSAWRGNARDNAWRFTMERIQSSTDPLLELQWLYAHSTAWQQPLFSNRVVQEIVSLLLQGDREGEALRSVRERLLLDPGFRPRTDEQTRRLGELAQQWGDRSTAVALLGSP
ncbi:MAG: hypothetical protein ACRET0_08695 [Steroidobacteraceae bacterium]